MKLLDRYVLREFFVPLAAGLGLFVFILVMNKIVDLLDLVLNRGISPLIVVQLIGCVLPSIIALALPMATLLAATLAFGRLAQDRELLAFKSAGTSLGRLARPLIGAGLGLSLLLLVFNGTVMPLAAGAYKRIFFEIIRQRATVAFRERVFVRDFDRYLLYFRNKEGKEGTLRDVYIVENPPVPPRVITARTGRLKMDPDGYTVKLLLEHGAVDQPADLTGQRATRIEFETYEVDLDIHSALRGGDQFFVKELQEMTYTDLRKRIRDLRMVPDQRREYEAALHEKIALAFAPFFVILIGVPLGSLARRGGGFGIVLSLAVIFIYYFWLVLARGLVDRGQVEPWLAMWVPNVFLACSGGAAFMAAYRESSWIRWGR